MTEADLLELYSELPKLECAGKCQASCGPIVTTHLEWGRIRDYLGWWPKWKYKRGKDGLRCPLLREERSDGVDGSGRVTWKCRVYEVRPFLCRLWGLTEATRCPHGCEPERFLSEAEAQELFRRLWEE